MAGPRSQGGKVPTKKIVRSRERQERIDRSRRANVRTVRSTPENPKGSSDVDSGTAGPATRNADALARAGSQEAKAFNANVAGSFQRFDNAPEPFAPTDLRSNPTAPTIANASALHQAPAQTATGTVSAATAEQSAAMSPAGRFRSAVQQAFLSSGDINALAASGDTPTEAGVLGGALLGIVGGRAQGSKLTLEAIAKAGYGKTVLPQVGKAIPIAKNTAGLIKANTKNHRALMSGVRKVLIGAGIVGGASSVVLSVLGSYAFSKFIGIEETGQTLGFAANIAGDADPDLSMEIASDIRKVATDRSLWESAIGWIPGINVGASIEKNFVPALIMQARAIETSAQDKILQEDGGMTSDQVWELRQQQRQADALALNDDFLETQRQFLVMKNAAEAANRVEEAKYWSDQLAQREAYEERQRKAEQAYWEWYFKQKAVSQAQSAPSKLSFGLI